MRRASRRAALALAGLFGGLVGGCSADDATLAEVCPNGGCPPGAAPADRPLEVILTPSPSSRYVPVARTEVELPLGRDWRLSLAEPIRHDTVVLGPDGPVDAALSFLPAGAMNLALVHEARAESPVPVPLPPGSYTVRIAPADPSLPPVEVSDFRVEPGNGPRTKEFALPSPYRRLFGVVRSRVSSATRIPMARVSAVGLESGLASEEVWSDFDGRFELRLPDAGDSSFLLRAAPPENHAPAWTYEQVVRVPLGEDREKAVDLDLPSDAIRGTLDLEVVGLGPRGAEPVPGATVRLTSTSSVGGLPRVFRLEGRTDAQGRFRLAERDIVPIIRGRYRADIVPPPDATYAAASQTLDVLGAVAGAAAEVQIALRTRPILRGMVTDELGRPTAYARVELVPLGRETRAVETETGPNGRFEAGTDPGRVLVRVEPYEAMLPSHAIAVDVPAEGEVPAVRIELPPTSVVRGEIVGGDEAGVPAVDVAVWTTTEGFRHRVARTDTDAMGRFTLVLPGR